MNPPLLPWRIVLASASPRRHQLIQSLGLPLEIVRIDVDETPPPGMPPAEVAEHLACRKADAWTTPLAPDQVLVTADTTVVVGNELLNKPEDAADARRMLGMLCGRTHAVHTGVCLRTTQRTRSFTDTTQVRMAALSPAEIAWYVEHHKPFDKAGAYGVQDWIGLVGVEAIQGNFYTVMGLPTHRLYQALQELAP